MQETRWTRLAFIVLLVGMGISIYLTVHHYDLIYGMRNTKSFCTISEAIDCDAVNSSSYSEIFGIPVGLVGAVTFFVQLLLLLGYRSFSESEKPRLARFFFYLSAGNVLFSLYLGLASLFVLKIFCLLCAGLYLISLILFICGWKLIRGPKFGSLLSDFRALFQSENGARGVLVLLALIPLGSLLAHGMYKQNVAGEIDRLVGVSVSDWMSTPKFDFHFNGDPEMGNPQAPFVLVTFSDFECPHCKRAAPSMHAFAAAHKNDVRLVFQNYPLDSSCNPNMQGGGGHRNACLLAKASLCANKLGKFWQAHDWIFAHQEGISEGSVDEMVKELGFDAAAFKTCLADSETTAQLSRQIERGQLAGVKGTPSVFANGKLLQGGFLIPVLEEAFKRSKGP
jgi:uncharacterized membrane protein/predicted DsbA family dithiol-disulfide isomerase